MELTIKRGIYISFKIIVSITLLWLVMQKAGLQNVIHRFRSMNAWLFLLSILLYLIMAYLVAIRWSLLLDKMLPPKKLFSLHMIGSFFNNILPSSIGGDAVKVYYLYRHTKKGGISFGSVFLDRYAGLFARLLIGLVSGLFAYKKLQVIHMHLAIPVFFTIFLTVSVVIFKYRIGRRFSGVADFYDYFHGALKKKTVILKALFLSVVIQMLLISMIFVIALGIGQRLSFTELFVFVPIIITMMVIPASISGIGVREGAFVVLFGLTGVPSHVSVSISFLWYLSMAAASIVGLAEYLRYRKQSNKKAPEE